MFSQCGKTGDDDGESKYDKQEKHKIYWQRHLQWLWWKITLRETVNAIHRETQRGCIIIL